MAVVTQIQIRRGTAAQWTSTNPTLAAGEQGFETDTGKMKVGNGSTAWTSLAYLGAGTVTSIIAGTGLSGGTITTTGTIAIDSTVATLTGSQTLTNKTLTAPVISSISNTGTLTLPTTTDTLVGRATTDTLTNKTLTTPVISSISNSGTVTLPTGTVTLASLTGTETLTNKTLTTPVITNPKITLTYSAKTAAYTAVTGDEGGVFSMNNASSIQFNIPTDATFNFAIGTQFNVFWLTGAGQPTIGAVTPGTTTVISTGATSATPKLRVANSMATALKIAANSWIVIGDIS